MASFCGYLDGVYEEQILRDASVMWRHMAPLSSPSPCPGSGMKKE